MTTKEVLELLSREMTEHERARLKRLYHAYLYGQTSNQFETSLNRTESGLLTIVVSSESLKQVNKQ